MSGPERAVVPTSCPERSCVPKSSQERAFEPSPEPVPARGLRVNKFLVGGYTSPAEVARPIAKATEAVQPWPSELPVSPWFPEPPAPLWPPGLPVLLWPPELPAPSWPPELLALPWVPELIPPWRPPVLYKTVPRGLQSAHPPPLWKLSSAKLVFLFCVSPHVLPVTQFLHLDLINHLVQVCPINSHLSMYLSPSLFSLWCSSHHYVMLCFSLTILPMF
ncbi:proline-rich receptor-like protein kinase PERK14 [Cyprinus carpio]|uniref:Proline-rich receptor-like protein kinase PERK14 n=1 Tax=Cyprinus carpio TaxID=7962 RepID=A0A9Q9WCG5_CYPCA|nr:proline-rich receptor-like protein kinase PERK14 [Cyprinus carpio]XP_042580846.1 proline-rich receptor-like protein kinase PERK14 [Cyprinus carpio]